MRRPLIAGNWKMAKTAAEAEALIRDLVPRVTGVTGVDIAVCPPFTALGAVRAALAGTAIGLGAQDLHWEKEGAFTGEVSAPMLVEAGCRYVIVGHSERRQYFGETDGTVRKKAAAALRHGLTPIVCVGETLEEREAGRTPEVVDRQVRAGLEGLDLEPDLVVAYEPVWAIGTGRTATPAQANAVHGLIRRRLGELFGAERAARVRILYGGSVKPENVAALMAEAEIDGALVGGASLQADAFARIVRYRVP